MRVSLRLTRLGLGIALLLTLVPLGGMTSPMSVIAEGITLLQVSAGGGSTCVVNSAGRLSCWGANSSVPSDLGAVSQVSTGYGHTCALTHANTLRCWGSPEATVPSDLRAVSQVSAGGRHTCAVTSTGGLRCWGADFFGAATVPSDLGAVSQVSAGAGHTCAMTSADGLRCWGDNNSGAATVPSDLGAVSQVSAGTLHTCAVTSTSGLRCWGDNSFGEATMPSDLGAVSQVSAGYAHTCAVTSTGGLRCWGDNFLGAATVPSDLGAVSQVSAGNGHTCAVTSTGGLRCWGFNNSGQAAVPSDLGAVSQVSAGTLYTCAVTSAGGLRCWGRNDSGQATVPSDLGTVSLISVGTLHTCAVTSAGGLRCWGLNDFGQATVPSDLGAVSQVSVGGGHTCAVTSADGLRCWGRNDSGQATVPSDLGTVSQVSAGWYSTCAVTSAGALRCWGDNFFGQASVPSDLGMVSQVSAGVNHTCAVMSTGGLRCWGLNDSGQTMVPSDPLGPLTAYAISGRVHTNVGVGIAGVTIATNTSLRTTTAIDGAFTLVGVAPGSYTLTPTKRGYTFTPATLSVTVSSGDLSGQDFVGVEKPSIVVLVHGWQGINPDSQFACRTSLTTGYTNATEAPPGWGELGTLLTQSGYRVYVASWTTRPGDSMTAEEAASQCLAPAIRSVADQDRDGNVILIAHSMGGLVSRAYIEDTRLYQQNVERLITLGTPHTGVNIQSLLKLIALRHPATTLRTRDYCAIDPGTCQLGSDQAFLFNLSHQPNTAVTYNLVAGLGGPWWLDFLNDTEGRNDGIVGDRSALWSAGLPFISDVKVEARGYTHATHSSTFGTSYVDHQESLSCVSQFLDIPNRSHDCATQVQASQDLSSASLPTAYTPSRTGTLETGNTLTTTLDLDGSTTDVLLGWDRGTLSMTLTTPDGVVVDGTNVGQIVPGASTKEPANASDLALVAYHLPAAMAGRWTATIAASRVVTDTNYTLFAATQSPLQVSVAAPASVGSGQALPVTTTISESTTLIDGATVVASLPGESGAQQVTLNRTAAGIYTGQLIAPTNVGPHILTVTANGGAGKPFARQLDQMITVRASGVQRQGAATVTPIDRNGNGRYEALQVTTPYTVTIAGDYTALATLQDTRGRSIATARTTATWATGTQTLRFAFDGGDIAATGVNGPYQVIVQIIAADTQHLVADEQPLITGLNDQAARFEFLSWVYLPLIRR